MPESLFSGLVAVRSFLSLIGTAASLLSQQEDARTFLLELPINQPKVRYS